MKRVGDAISALARDLGMEGAVSIGRIKREWAALFNNGPLARHTMPAELKDRRLLVHVDSPAWLHQLNFHKRQMIQKLEPFGVSDITLRIGRIYPDSAPRPSLEPDTPLKHSISQDDALFISQTTADIGDEALGRAVKGAIEGWASRRRPSVDKPKKS